MTPEEQLNRIQQTLDYVATLQRSHDEQIGKLVEQVNRNEKRLARLTERMDVLTQRTIQAMDAINRLTRIVESHAD